MLPYDSHDNPFDDPHLDKVFVWKKKAKKLGWSKSEAKEHAEALRKKNLVEIENAKRRRVEREREQAERLLERERLERERDSASHAGWEQREEQFMLRQHQQASALRINQGRERAVDMVARNVLLTKQLRHGPEIGADGKAMALLGEDVGIENTSPLELFSRLTVRDLTQLKDDLVKYRRLEPPTSEFCSFWDALLVVCEDELTPIKADSPIPQTVRNSIRESCSGKTLTDVQHEREDALARAKQAAQGSEDFRFFSELEQRLAVEESRCYIRDCHTAMLQTAKEHGRTVHQVQRYDDRESSALPAHLMEESEENEDQTETALLDVIDIPLEKGWVKPKYWNRVRSGYDWNKYNRAHYDRDNPPPKAVFGYRFNILYPGLKKTPTYTFQRDETDPENFCIIRFVAAHPYADVAFRIEKREWDRSGNSGFKNTFENGVLQLHFNFTRRRYRR